jgi:MYXO-CTERM domain-containing protein
VQLASLIRQDVPELRLKAEAPLLLPASPPPLQGIDTPRPAALPGEKAPDPQDSGGCAACAAAGRGPGPAPSHSALLAAAALAVALAARRRDVLLFLVAHGGRDPNG